MKNEDRQFLQENNRVNKRMKSEFYKKKLKNGLTILFEKRSLPVVCSSVSVRAGSEFEAEKMKGVSHFIEHLVFKGTKKRTQKEISAEIEKKGGIINAFTSEEITCFWNKLPSKHLATSLDIASDLVLNPLFDEKELEKERKVILEEIKMYHDNPQIYVLEKIKELLYEKPFGMFTAGSAETMSRIKREEVLKVYGNYSTNNMILTVVGKAGFEEICEIARKIFLRTERKIQERKTVLRNSQLVEKRKGLEQANLVFGYHAPTLQDKNRYVAELLDTILAKGMSSKLFQEIREKRGLAYAVRGFLNQDRNYGYEAIYIGTVKEKVKKVKELILKELKKMEKFEQRELEEAKEQLIGLRNLESEDSEQVMVDLITEENAGSAEEYYAHEERVNSVKLEEVRRLAKLKGYSFIALVPE